MATERQRPERRVARMLRGPAGGTALSPEPWALVWRLTLLGVLAFLGWCGLALLSGASASAAETPRSAPASESSSSSSLLGTSALSDVLDEATSAVRSAGSHPFEIVSVRPSDQEPAHRNGAEASRAGRTDGDETTRTGAEAGLLAGGTEGTGGTRSTLGLVSVPVRGLPDPGASTPVDAAVSMVGRTLGHVTGTPLGSVTGGLVAPLGATVTHATSGLAAAAAGAVPTARAAGTVHGVRAAATRVATPTGHSVGPGFGVRSDSAVRGTDDGAQPPAAPTDHRHIPSAPATGAPAMPFGVVGGSAPVGGGGSSAGGSGVYLDFAGVRPSAASGPVWTVRHIDEQVPLDNPDRPRVSPD